MCKCNNQLIFIEDSYNNYILIYNNILAETGGNRCPRSVLCSQSAAFTWISNHPLTVLQPATNHLLFLAPQRSPPRGESLLRVEGSNRKGIDWEHTVPPPGFRPGWDFGTAATICTSTCRTRKLSCRRPGRVYHLFQVKVQLEFVL